ncbi:hypothetical protein C1H46_045796 [Malus baccata]|uniref:Uncharacterized protein n=1 Tax=Malus baccata TaxID=106549 RepID=A0A540K340_MALBA|nr:hypothetical protein C1H46_045796 [Malus baccata]
MRNFSTNRNWSVYKIVSLKTMKSKGSPTNMTTHHTPTDNSYFSLHLCGYAT